MERKHFGAICFKNKSKTICAIKTGRKLVIFLLRAIKFFMLQNILSSGVALFNCL